MKKNGTSNAILVPDGRGWRVRIEGGEDQTLLTLDDAIAVVPANAHVELALPCNSVLLERHKFPATDRAELADIVAGDGVTGASPQSFSRWSFHFCSLLHGR
jgi:hypothetical protein